MEKIDIDKQIEYIQKKFDYHDKMDNMYDYDYLKAILETLTRFKYQQR